ncbi:hypothetical protein Sjap_009754 [Stephania japonica]|uniref:Peptidase M14 domain-containing protein n=1 Tax=Stephania japonica TaxID=461633 RepID=A0AAP0J7Q2_9MAGN
MGYFLVFILIWVSLLCSVVNGRNLSRSSFTPINRDLYRSGEVFMEDIKALVGRHPDRLTMETIKTQNKGYYAEILVVTYGSSAKAIYDKSKFRVLLSFGQHGRELITSELALRLLSIISGEHSMPNMDPISLNSTLSKLVLKVVPMENRNGRKLVEDGDHWRGVDLNRNWSVDWGKKEKVSSYLHSNFFVTHLDYDPYEENPGVAPFSEPETQIMRKVSGAFNPHLWVNVHSGMEALFMPYDHKNRTPDGLLSDTMKFILKDVNRLHCKGRCLVGSGGGSVGYLAHGTATDYMYDVNKVPMSFTFEIYGDKEASTKDCFKMFNPIDLKTYNRVLNDWCGAFVTIFEMGPRRLEAMKSSNGSADGNKLISIDEYLEGYLMERSSRYGKRVEVLELGMQEIRTYFRLFLLSSVLLMFMFCSRISKSKYTAIRPIVSAVPL